jgi:polysaccharide biosynthesis/export protein
VSIQPLATLSRVWLLAGVLAGMAAFSPVSLAAQDNAAQNKTDYQLGAGDAIRITVFQNPDLTVETRVSESGGITFPLVGVVPVGGLSTTAAEELIAQKLKSGNFVKRPQVNIVLTEVRSSQVAVLGLVNKPSRFPMDSSGVRLSEMLSSAGGVLPAAGTGTAILTGIRDGKTIRQEIDIASLFSNDAQAQDVVVKGGDVIYVMAGNQVSVLGQVNHPGRYPLENFKMRLSEVLTLAGGVSPSGSDIAIITGQRDGKPYRKEVDIAALYLNDQSENNVRVADGDEIYVARAPVFYIYGEAQKPGSYRVERNMTVIQALAQGGGPTVRGTQRNIKLLRRQANGSTTELSPKMSDLVQADDVLYVRESLF